MLQPDEFELAAHVHLLRLPAIMRPHPEPRLTWINRQGRPLTGTAIRRLFDRLKVRTGIRDLCAHMLRHTWATNYNRSRTGSTFDLQVEGGWTTARMVDRYCKVRPLAERRRAPSPFTAPRAARTGKEKRPSEMRPSPKESALGRRRLARITA